MARSETPEIIRWTEMLRSSITRITSHRSAGPLMLPTSKPWSTWRLVPIDFVLTSSPPSCRQEVTTRRYIQRGSASTTSLWSAHRRCTWLSSWAKTPMVPTTLCRKERSGKATGLKLQFENTGQPPISGKRLPVSKCFGIISAGGVSASRKSGSRAVSVGVMQQPDRCAMRPRFTSFTVKRQ